MNETSSKREESATFVLGAGASRSVSYAACSDVQSPLDRDFFDLLQRLAPREKDEPAVEWVRDQIGTLPFEYRRSLEKTFYTLHLRSYLRRKLTGATMDQEENVIGNFARAVVAVLRKAHGTETCQYHQWLFAGLSRHDAIISFNYDLVVERALRADAKRRGSSFSPTIYRLADHKSVSKLPKVLKLHGSVNWRLVNKKIEVRTKSWEDLAIGPGYRGYSGEGTRFPIFLPFWDKRVTDEPWLPIWRKAHQQLGRTSYIIVWGFSLPWTDVKVRELFAISVADGGDGKRLCVIDPSQATRDRWRELLPNAQYWEYPAIEAFRASPPSWWWNTSSKIPGAATRPAKHG